MVNIFVLCLQIVQRTAQVIICVLEHLRGQVFCSKKLWCFQVVLVALLVLLIEIFYCKCKYTDCSNNFKGNSSFGNNSLFQDVFKSPNTNNLRWIRVKNNSIFLNYK